MSILNRINNISELLNSDINIDLLRIKINELQREASNPIQVSTEILNSLSEDERMDVISNYCRYCGSSDPNCQCWNDD